MLEVPTVNGSQHKDDKGEKTVIPCTRPRAQWDACCPRLRSTVRGGERDKPGVAAFVRRAATLLLLGHATQQHCGSSAELPCSQGAEGAAALPSARHCSGTADFISLPRQVLPAISCQLSENKKVKSKTTTTTTGKTKACKSRAGLCKRCRCRHVGLSATSWCLGDSQQTPLP